MSLETLAKQLRALPYSDMKLLSQQLYEHLLKQPYPMQALDPQILADALAAIAACPSTPSRETQLEEDTLRKIFSRKRQINVKVYNTGYVVDIPSLPASTVTGRNIRDMLQQMLDQIITIKLMELPK